MERARRGVKEVVRGGPNGSAFEILYTWRRPCEGKPYGGYQVACFHHPAEASVGRTGKLTMLRCVKELPCEAPDDDTRLLELLEGWVCDAEAWGTRRDHMASLNRPKSKEHRLSWKAGTKDAERAAGAGRSSRSSSMSSSSSTTSRPSDSESSSETGAGGDRPCPESGSAPPLCWICAGAHRLEDCHIWRSAKEASLLESGTIAVSSVPGSSGIMLATNSVVTRDVPGDGNCLFHALQRELRPDAKTGRPGLLQPGMDGGADGQALRDWLMRYLQALPDEVEGQPLQALLGMSLAEYMREMRLPSGRASWGGYLEVFFISRALGVSVLMLTMRATGFHVTAWTNQDLQDLRRTLAVAWCGIHWQRARLSQEAWGKLLRSSRS